MTRPLTPTQLSEVDQITAEFGRQLGILVETHRRLLAKGDQAPVATITAMLADDPEWGEPALTALAAVAVGSLARMRHAVEQLADHWENAGRDLLKFGSATTESARAEERAEVGTQSLCAAELRKLDLQPAEQDAFLNNLKAVNAELDEMVRYWQIIRPSGMFPNVVLDMHASLRESRPTESHLYRLLVIAVARLAGEQ